MTTTVYRKDRTTPRREGEVVRVESMSRPGFFHFVDVERGHCSCEHASFTGDTCKHVRIALVRRAKSARQTEPRKTTLDDPTRYCRECGGAGRFFWGAQDHGECDECRGTGRRAA